MNRLFQILVAVDFSEPARSAFQYALELSRTHNAELTVVHAVPSDEPFGRRARQREVLFGQLRHEADTAGVRFSVSVQHGNPAGVILLHAGARRPDLIVLGTHQRKGLDRLRFGSIAETVTLRARQPVLVVPVDADSRAASRVTSLDKIVAAVDFGPGSIGVVQEALSLAAPTKGRVTFVHVVEQAPPGSVSRYTVPEYRTQRAHDAWQRLQDAVPADARTSANVHARVVMGHPETEILDLANDLAADVIVVGVPARGPIGRRLFGTTAARLMRMTDLPVLAVPERLERTTVLPTAA